MKYSEFVKEREGPFLVSFAQALFQLRFDQAGPGLPAALCLRVNAGGRWTSPACSLQGADGAAEPSPRASRAILTRTVVDIGRQYLDVFKNSVFTAS